MTNTTAKKPLLSVGTMTRIAILAAAASILFLLEIPIVAFYKLDLSNIPVMLGVMALLCLPALVKGKLSRWQGVTLLCVYAAFTVFQFVL